MKANGIVLIGVVAGALTLVGNGAEAQGQTGPTFDCAKASGQIEILICKDPALGTLDRRMAQVYATALKKWPATLLAEKRAYQRGWISGRNECWKEPDARACTELSYRTRIVQIQIESGQLVAPIPVGYACSGGPDQPFTVSFYKTTEPASTVITYGQGQVIAFSAPAASGAKYTARNVEFWEHQGEASVNWFGTTLTCRPRSAPASAAATRQSIGGTSWILERFQSMDDTTLQPGMARYKLTFNADGTLVVEADCNRGRGSWRSPDNVTLALVDVALTQASCAPSPLQDRFVRDLEFVRSYVLEDGKLHLNLMADGGIYTFRPGD